MRKIVGGEITRIYPVEESWSEWVVSWSWAMLGGMVGVALVWMSLWGLYFAFGV